MAHDLEGRRCADDVASRIAGGNASRVLEVAASSAVTLSGVTVTAGSGVGTGSNDPFPMAKAARSPFWGR